MIRLAFSDCRIVLPDGRLVTAHPFGPPHANGPLMAFSLFHGSHLARTSAADCVDVAYIGRHALALKTGGAMPIPRAGCVIRFANMQEALAAVHNPIRHKLKDDNKQLQNGVQAGPIIVENGGSTEISGDVFAREIMHTIASLPDHIPVSPFGWDANWHETRAARLAAGITASGDLFFMAVEGTSSFLHDEQSAQGATLADLAALMIEEGAESALNLDGGGSAQLFLPAGGAFLRPRDIHHDMLDIPAQFDRPLPLALRLC